jgi:hypothetical protein
MRVQHMVDADGSWYTDAVYEVDGVPACARLPGRHSIQGVEIILRAKRIQSSPAMVKYVQH